MTPQMDRRTVVKCLGGTLVGLGGMTASVAGDTTATPRITKAWFHADDAECTNQDNDEATVACKGRTIRVAGTIAVPDPCYDAVLRTAEYDRESEEFQIVIGAERTDGFCIQCLAASDYELTARIGNGYPERVVVYHEVGDERKKITAASCDRPIIPLLPFMERA